MTEREFYEHVATAYNCRWSNKGLDYVQCPFCAALVDIPKPRLPYGDFEAASKHLAHSADCPVLYARARLEELDNEHR